MLLISKEGVESLNERLGNLAEVEQCKQELGKMMHDDEELRPRLGEEKEDLQVK